MSPPVQPIVDLCLFAHFDKHDVVDAYVHRYLREIRALGFRIVFVSTSALSDDQIVALREVCEDVILRENRGIDFGSWADGYRRYRGRFSGNLLLANDSVYGPIGSLAEAVSRMASEDADFYGMVESMQFARHVQSWFVLLRPRAYRHPAFEQVLASDFGAMTKMQVVMAGELRLSQRLLAAGLRMHALARPHRRRFPKPIFLNPTQFLWRELVEDEGLPFVKVDLLRDNRNCMSSVADWRSLVRSREPLLEPLIERHLARMDAEPSAAKEELRALQMWWLSEEAFARRDYRLARSDKLKAIAHRLGFSVLDPVLTMRSKWRARRYHRQQAYRQQHQRG